MIKTKLFDVSTEEKVMTSPTDTLRLVFSKEIEIGTTKPTLFTPNNEPGHNNRSTNTLRAMFSKEIEIVSKMRKELSADTLSRMFSKKEPSQKEATVHPRCSR